jgi:hypothetical protein
MPELLRLAHTLLGIQLLIPFRLLVYYPIMAVLVLFTNIVTHRVAVVPANDIAIMEIVTGMFGSLNFVSSGTIALSRIGEFPRIARDYLEMDPNFEPGDCGVLDNEFTSAELQDFDVTTLMDSTTSPHVV